MHVGKPPLILPQIDGNLPSSMETGVKYGSRISVLRTCAQAEHAPLAVFLVAAHAVEQEQGEDGEGFPPVQAPVLRRPSRYDLECFAEQTAELLQSIGWEAQVLLLLGPQLFRTC